MAVKRDFAEYSVYEVKPIRPGDTGGWCWELHKTYESAGPFTYDEAVRLGAIRAAEVKAANEK